MDQRAVRVGENEALFRGINERLEDLAEGFGWVTGTLQIVCECGDRTCIERIELKPDEYERVRAEGALFAVSQGHNDPSVEDVVADHGAWVVVRKHEGGPAKLAEQLDPRTP